jgi:hypothetical protein
MQTDLIKRGEVLKIINEHRNNFNQMEEEIMKLECAYDMERVVEELEKAEEKAKEKYNSSFELHQEEFWRGRMTLATEMIRNIRNGGKE